MMKIPNFFFSLKSLIYGLKNLNGLYKNKVIYFSKIENDSDRELFLNEILKSNKPKLHTKIDSSTYSSYKRINNKEEEGEEKINTNFLTTKKFNSYVKPINIIRDKIILNLNYSVSFSQPDKKISQNVYLNLKNQAIEDVDKNDPKTYSSILLTTSHISKILMLNPYIVIKDKEYREFIEIIYKTKTFSIQQTDDNKYQIRIKINSNTKNQFDNPQNQSEIGLIILPEELFLIKKFLEICLSEILKN